MLLVDRWRLSDHAKRLWRVLLNVLVRAWIDEVDLEIRRSLFRYTRARKIPSVDIIFTQVVNSRNRSMERFQCINVAGERCPFRSEQRW